MWVQKVVEAIVPLANFIGGYPMAGTADSGISCCAGFICAEALCAYTSSNDTGSGSEDCGKIAHRWEPLYIIVARMTNDRAVSWVSHLPVIVSAGLIAACMSETDPGVLALAQHLASSVSGYQPCGWR